GDPRAPGLLVPRENPCARLLHPLGLGGRARPRRFRAGGAPPGHNGNDATPHGGAEVRPMEGERLRGPSIVGPGHGGPPIGIAPATALSADILIPVEALRRFPMADVFLDLWGVLADSRKMTPAYRQTAAEILLSRHGASVAA